MSFPDFRGWIGTCAERINVSSHCHLTKLKGFLLFEHREADGKERLDQTEVGFGTVETAPPPHMTGGTMIKKNINGINS